MIICPCGRPLHYANPRHHAAVDRLVEALGETVDVVVAEGTWRVPRHYIALHGLSAAELPALAQRLGFEAVAR